MSRRGDEPANDSPMALVVLDICAIGLLAMVNFLRFLMCELCRLCIPPPIIATNQSS